MMDVHTHILPAMDDGSKNVKMSVEMLREEKAQGMELVIFTPHYYAHQNSPQEFLRRRQKAWDELQSVWHEETPRLLLGAEVQYFEGICEVEDLMDLRIQGTNILLLEMPFFKWTDRMVRDVLELQDRHDVQILLAHIDRYEKYYTKDMLDILLRSGVLIQMNCSAFEGLLSRHKALSMIKKGQVHIFASDCHNMGSRAPTLGKWKKYVDNAPAERLLRAAIQ